MKRILLTLLLAAAATCLGFVPAASGGDDPYDCGLLAVDEAGEPTCRDDEAAGAGRPVDPSCRIEVEAVFWAGGDWLRLAQALAADPQPCGEYAVSIPPLASNKTMLRAAQDDLVRALGVHPLAELNLGELTGWANWARTNQKSWFEIGVEFRRRMAEAKYQSGETWIVNELDQTTIRDVDRGVPNPPVPAYRRADVRLLLQGLFYGDVGMEPLPGIVLLGIPFRQQNIPDVDGYRRDLQGFLADEGFWGDVDRYTRAFAVEQYPDSRFWGVEGSSRAERRRHLEDYLFNVLELARSGPDEAAVAREVLERKFMPFANAIWRARGGEKFAFAAGAGNTILDDLQMRHFVSEQVHAIRFHAGSHPQGAPGGRIGFAWQPCNRLSADEAGCRPQDKAFVAGLDAIAARLAESIHHAYRQGGASPVGACAVPGSELDWCQGAVPGASFTEAWAGFEWAA